MVNPDDVFPPSSQPNDDAAKWARIVQDRQVSAEKELQELHGAVQGINRNIAASLAAIGDQLNELQQQQNQLSAQQTEIQNILSDQLKVQVYGSAGTNSNITSTNPVTVRSSTVSIPAGFSVAHVFAVSTLSGNIGSDASNRVILETRIAGTDYGYDQTSSPPAFQRTTGSSMGTAIVTNPTFTVELRARAAVAQTITGVYSNLRVMVIFTK